MLTFRAGALVYRSKSGTQMATVTLKEVDTSDVPHVSAWLVDLYGSIDNDLLFTLV